VNGTYTDGDISPGQLEGHLRNQLGAYTASIKLGRITTDYNDLSDTIHAEYYPDHIVISAVSQVFAAVAKTETVLVQEA
jgi:hypothetical protein